MSISKSAKRDHGLLIALVLFILLGAASPAMADDARARYEEGVALFEAQRFLEAARAFQAAMNLKPSWKLYYNIGQAEAAARRYGRALDAFEAYLVEGGDEVGEARREAIIREIKSFKVLVGTLEVIGPRGAELYVDDELRATIPINGILRLAAGEHHVLMKKEDAVLLDKTVRVVGEETTLVRAEPPGDRGASTGDDISGDGDNRDAMYGAAGGSDADGGASSSGLSRLALFGIVAGGVGLATAGSGIPLFLIGGDFYEKAENTYDPSEFDKWSGQYEKYNALSIGLFVAGGVLVATGATLLVIGLRKNKSDNKERARILPIPGGVAVRF